MAGGSGLTTRSGVRVAVIGDRGTGKSTLIAAAASDSVPEKVPPVHPPTRLPPDIYPDRVPVTIIDTPSRYTCSTGTDSIYVSEVTLMLLAC